MNVDEPADIAPGNVGPHPLPEPTVPREQQLLRQAGDVIENLRAQMAELDRREQNVAAQTTALENERRRLRLSQQQVEEQHDERAQTLREQEEALQRRVAEAEASLQQHQSREQELLQQQAQLEDDRASLRESVAEELAEERAELNRRRAELEQQRTEWDDQRGARLAAIDEEIAAESSNRRAALEAELLTLADTVANEQQEFAAECARRHEELASLREEAEAIRQEKLGEIERREVNLQRKQVDLEKRTRFHESHLEQMRRDLETKQAAHDRSLQLGRAERVHMADVLDAYRTRLLRSRDRVTQREESIERERHLVDDLRRSLEATARSEQSRREQDLQSWEHECIAHRADMRRQQDMLTLHAQNLESRRVRLDQLRDDLEQTHRETLELRLSVEQVWGQLSQTFGEETTRKRVEQARTDLVAGYERIRESLLEQQAEIDAAEQRLSGQRERFRTEREEFSVWMSEREQQLRRREESLQQDIEAATAGESQWRTTRERWTVEKIEAESVIRQLLEELDADLTRPALALPAEVVELVPPSVRETERDEPSAAA